MASCTLVIKDFVNAKFEGLDPITRKKFVNALKFDVPHARHTPQFKLKRWDGKVQFGTMGGGTQINLLDRVLQLVMDAGYEIEIDDRRPDLGIELGEIFEDELAEFTWPEGHRLAGQPIILNEHQIRFINTFFDAHQSIQEIAVGAGKTISCAAMSRRVEQKTGGRTIVVVPSKDLVLQTTEDYENVKLDVGMYFGDDKSGITKQHVIATWQSLENLDKNSNDPDAKNTIENMLEDVTCVIIDECHSAKGAVLRNLLCGPFASVPLRWGMSGTIPKEEYAFMALLSSIGPVVGAVSIAELQEKGVLAKCEFFIEQTDDSHVQFADYDAEHSFLLTDKTRLVWLAGRCKEIAETGNTLILVDRREVGKYLEKAIPGSKFIWSKIKSKDRKIEYKSVETSTNKVIIATYGVASTGINIPSLFNLVILECGKSFTRSIQSAGRSLRISNVKTFARIWDICSNLKFSKRHLPKRKEYYDEAGFKYTVKKVKYR